MSVFIVDLEQAFCKRALLAFYLTQLAITCSKLTIETLNKSVNMFDFNKENTRCEICLKLIIKHQNDVIFKFEHISHLFLVFLSL